MWQRTGRRCVATGSPTRCTDLGGCWRSFAAPVGGVRRAKTARVGANACGAVPTPSNLSVWTAWAKSRTVRPRTDSSCKAISPTLRPSHPEIRLTDRRLVGEHLGAALHGDAAGLDDQAVARDLE